MMAFDRDPIHPSLLLNVWPILRKRGESGGQENDGAASKETKIIK